MVSAATSVPWSGGAHFKVEIPYVVLYMGADPSLRKTATAKGDSCELSVPCYGD